MALAGGMALWVGVPLTVAAHPGDDPASGVARTALAGAGSGVQPQPAPGLLAAAPAGIAPVFDVAGSSWVQGLSPAFLQTELERVATRFAAALAQENADQMARLLSDQGIRLRLPGLDRSALSVRQAQAALRDFLRGYEPGTTYLVRAAPVAGSPGRGFAEVRWQTRVAGTSHPAVHSVFLGLVEGEEGWRVDEFRLLP